MIHARRDPLQADVSPRVGDGLSLAIGDLFLPGTEGLRFEALDGITSTAYETGFQYDPWLAFPSRDELRSVLGSGVALALDRYARKPAGAAYVRENIYDPARAAWQVVCPVRPNSVVLDFGCGLGAVSRSLARNCAVVIGIDACYERLMVNGSVNRELGFDNVRLVCADHRMLDRIRPASIDGIALNGVLEWVPEMLSGPPTSVQTKFLRECRRILRPDGWLYIGIENRWGYPYFLGRHEEHADLVFASLLPRWLATIYCRAAKGKPYRTFTHGPRGYRRLVRSAGFAETALYGILPDYRSFSELRPPAAAEPARGAASRLGISKPWKQRVIETPAFFRRFVPSVGVVASASASTSQPPWMADINGSAALQKVYVKHDQASVWYQNANGEVRVREVALAVGARAKLCRIADLASHFERHGVPGGLDDLRLVASEGTVWIDRRPAAGRSLADLPADVGAARMDDVCGALAAIHDKASGLDWAVHGITSACLEYLGGGSHPAVAHWSGELQAIASEVERRNASHQLLMHGDCKAANIIVGDRIALIDWEWSRIVDFPGADVLKLQWGHDEDPRSPSRFWDAVLLARRLTDTEAGRRFQQVHPGADWANAVLTYWCLRTARQLRAIAERGWTPDWSSSRLKPSLDAVTHVLR